MQNLRIVFVETAIAQLSDDLGFYYLTPKNQFWEMLEYSRLTPTTVVSDSDRKALADAKHTGVLNDVYKQFFFEKKESEVLKHRIGLTALNRRRTVANDDDPSAEPTADDLQKFVKKIEKFKPKIVAFVMKPEIFEKCFKPMYPLAHRQRGKQDFSIGSSEVWLIGGTGGRMKDREALEQVFEDLADRTNMFMKESV